MKKGDEYRQVSNLNSLEEARLAPDGVVILEGDWGGQIYVTCPASLVTCWEPVLKLLLRDLNAMAWPRQPQGANIRYERLAVGQIIEGGKGGGQIARGMWVHDDFVQIGLAGLIRGVLRGRIGRIPMRERLRQAVLNGLKPFVKPVKPVKGGPKQYDATVQSVQSVQWKGRWDDGRYDR